MAGQHTPGPWSVVVRSAYTGNYLVKEAGPEDDYANARLIAAAPELLSALTDLLRYCSEPIYETTDLLEKDIFKKARAAIAKARGES